MVVAIFSLIAASSLCIGCYACESAAVAQNRALLQCLPIDVAQNVVQCLKDKHLCRLSRTNNANRLVTAETRDIRMRQEAERFRYRIQREIERLRPILVYGVRLIGRGSSLNVCNQLLFGFDGQMHRHREVDQLRFLLHRYREFFPSLLAVPFHRSENVRENISDFKMNLFDEYVALYKTAQGVVQKMQRNGRGGWLSISMLFEFVEHIGAHIEYPIGMVATEGMEATYAFIEPRLGAWTDIAPFAKRLKAFTDRLQPISNTQDHTACSSAEPVD